jgi:flagellar biosynthesis protein FlhG
MLGEIPDDPAVVRAVRSYLPVVEMEPTAPAAQALDKAADALLHVLSRPQPAASSYDRVEAGRTTPAA